MLSSSALFLGSRQQSFLLYLLQTWCLLPGLLFNYFPVIPIWKHCRFFPLYCSACDLFSCYPAGSCFFIDEDLLKWESFLQLNTFSLRNHSHFTCKGSVLKPIQAIQGNWCFLLCEVFFSQVVYVLSGREPCAVKRLFINNEHTEVLSLSWRENGERTNPQLLLRPGVTIDICPKVLALTMDLPFPRKVLLAMASLDTRGVMLWPLQKAELNFKVKNPFSTVIWGDATNFWVLEPLFIIWRVFLRPLPGQHVL